MSMNLCDIGTIKYIQKKFGFRNSKALGQNFLTEPAVIEAMVKAAEIGADDLVVEIGPGIGVLTAGIAEKAGKVVALELDRDLLPVLDFTLAEFDNVEIVNQDVLKTDIEEIVTANGRESTKILGNLPYYITTPIITSLLENGVPAECIVVMMQKEVAERIVSPPGSKAYGALSVAVQFYCDVEEVVEVGRECFLPSPKVDSAVLKLTPIKEPKVKVKDKEMFFRCVKAGFGQRRKTLNNSLSGTGFDKETIKNCLEKAAIEASRRAETLSLEEFARLADAFTEAN